VAAFHLHAVGETAEGLEQGAKSQGHTVKVETQGSVGARIASIASHAQAPQPPEVAAKLFTFAIIPPEVDKLYTRIWTELKTGN